MLNLNNDIVIEKPLKYGFDIHGVLDTYPYFVDLANSLLDQGGEVHIITGIRMDDLVKQKLKNLGVNWTNHFSIVEWLEQYCPHYLTWENGLPYAPDDIWNASKSLYCKANNIHVHYDDSHIYGKYFEKIDTIYCQVH